MSKRLTIEEFIKTLKSGGSGSGGAEMLMIDFEPEIHVNPEERYDVYLLSDVLWDDMIAAYTSGQPVMFHIPSVENDYGVIEGYAGMVSYDPDDGNGHELVRFGSSSSYIGGMVNGMVKDESTGFVKATVYVD